MLTSLSRRSGDLGAEVALSLSVGGASVPVSGILAAAAPVERVVLAFLVASLTALCRWLAGGGLL